MSGLGGPCGQEVYTALGLDRFLTGAWVPFFDRPPPIQPPPGRDGGCTASAARE
eukprot:CAMPEP_0197902300 /NCGR_PEP_ID=MMETSP1439-20131203/53084_1 /TAXON_ID=66791 /ORGANISM="Gonyaulax spinifera, Strain CCMP409" /LENGTH=53 /DNA_ID=CAMNT_0043523313 /DNA_START=76 /DNA_END=234 /DNA_ORIENTATION=-